MKKYHVLRLSLLSLIMLFSCSGDDDGNTQIIQSGFFPSKITTATIPGGNQTDYSFSYNNQNQISSIIQNGGLFDVSFEYDNEGFINIVSSVNLGFEASLEYDGDILVKLINTQDGIETPILYAANTYTDLSGNLVRHDTENNMVEFEDGNSSIDIMYNSNEGPFSKIDFQPVFYLLGEDFLRASFYMSASEINQIMFTSSVIGEDPSTTYAVVVERNENDLITKATLNNQLTGEPFLEYIIEYTER